MARPPKESLDNYTELELDLLEAADAMLEHVRSRSASKKVNVRKLRKKLHLTQEQFANFMGASVHSVRHWENGRRTPDGTAQRLLQVLQHNPQAVLSVLEQSNTP